MVDCAKLLETYTLEEILEVNEVPEEDVLLLLIEEQVIKLPLVMPIDVEK